MTTTQYFNSKLVHLENLIKSYEKPLAQFRKQLDELKAEISNLEPLTDIKTCDGNKLINDKKYRLEVALTECHGDKIKTAKMLNISERTLFRMLKKYDLYLYQLQCTKQS